MTMMMIITIEKGEAYHLVPKSILLVNIRVIWKVNTTLHLVQSFELNNAGQLTNTFVSWSLAVNLGMHFSRKFPWPPIRPQGLYMKSFTSGLSYSKVG